MNEITVGDLTYTEFNALALEVLPPQTDSCFRCGRELTHPVSMFLGFGPTCSTYLGVPHAEYCEIMDLGVEQLLNDPDIAEKIRKLREEMEAKNRIEGKLYYDPETEQLRLEFKYKGSLFSTLLDLCKHLRWRYHNGGRNQKWWYKERPSRREIEDMVGRIAPYAELIAIQEDLGDVPEFEPMEPWQQDDAALNEQFQSAKPDITVTVLKPGTVRIQLKYGCIGFDDIKDKIKSTRKWKWNDKGSKCWDVATEVTPGILEEIRVQGTTCDITEEVLAAVADVGKGEAETVAPSDESEIQPLKLEGGRPKLAQLLEHLQ